MTQIAIAVVEHDGLFLVGTRPEDVPLAGYSEFPGGKVEPGEIPAVAAARECWEETGIEVTIGEPYPEVTHTYDHDTLKLHFFRASPVEFIQPTNDQYQWVRRCELADRRFPDANAALVRQLVEAETIPTRDVRFWLGPVQALMLLAFIGLLVNSGGQLIGGEGRIAVLIGLLLLLLPVVNHAISRGRPYGLKSLWFDLTAACVSIYFSAQAGSAFLLVWIPLVLLRRL
jgi:8-oxo-dGTP diphosphatase